MRAGVRCVCRATADAAAPSSPPRPRPPGAVRVQVHVSWPAFMEAFRAEAGPKRLVAFTVYGSSYYAGAPL